MRNGIKVSVRVCLHTQNCGTRDAWQRRPVEGESRWAALVVLMDRENKQFQDFFVFPSVRDCGSYVPAYSPWLEQGVHLESLQMFCQVIRAVRAAREKRSENSPPSSPTRMKRPCHVENDNAPRRNELASLR